MRSGSVFWFIAALAFHACGALTWVAFLGFSADAGTERQFNAALVFGAATWLLAAVLMAWLWRSGHWPFAWLVPVAWWFPSFLLMIAVVYGWNSPVGGPEAAVPARNVASLAFGEAVAVPAAPRAGRGFVLRHGVTRSDYAGKFVDFPLQDINPTLDVAVTIDGENVEIESEERCSACRVLDATAEHWFSDDSNIWVRFPVPETAEGKRLAIKMTIDQADTPTATKVLTFTVRP